MPAVTGTRSPDTTKERHDKRTGKADEDTPRHVQRRRAATVTEHRLRWISEPLVPHRQEIRIMNKVNVRQLKELRVRTGAGVMECRAALEQTAGHVDQAEEWLRRKAIEDAARRGEREMKEGWITSYLHHNGKLGALVELNCETDFVARTEDFRMLARNIAEHIAASDATVVERGALSSEDLEGLRAAFAEQARAAGKPEKVVERIVEGRTAAHLREVVLLEQPWIRDPERTVGELVDEASGLLGERIRVRRFSRFRMGEE
jgi:elongation factor Ts